MVRDSLKIWIPHRPQRDPHFRRKVSWPNLRMRTRHFSGNFFKCDTCVAFGRGCSRTGAAARADGTRSARRHCPPKEETIILRTALPTLLRQSFKLRIVVGCRQIVVLAGQRCSQLWGVGGAEKKTDATQRGGVGSGRAEDRKHRVAPDAGRRSRHRAAEPVAQTPRELKPALAMKGRKNGGPPPSQKNDFGT
jgi:hypothetical protein